MNLDDFLNNFNVSKNTGKVIAPEKKVYVRPKRPSSGAHKARVPMVADFETTTDPLDCRVWAYGLVSVDEPEYENVEIGTTIDEFIDRIMQYNTTCYFHNLKFDGVFILDWLLNNDYALVHSDYLKRAGTFKTLINDMGTFYSITVKWGNGNSTEFRDSLKKLPMTVKKIADAWKLEESKGEMDYDAHNGPITRITPEEEDYLRRDVTIVAKALKETYINGQKRLTVGSDALAEYKSIVGAEWFKRTFPVFSAALDKEIRRAYRGGFTYRDPRFKGHHCKLGIVLDVNSLYPSVMMNRILPYGDPRWFDGEFKPTKEYPLGIFSITFTAKIKKDHIPCIQIKGSSMFSATEYLSNIKEPTTLMVTNVDWGLYQEHYDIDILEYGGGWGFHATRGLFDAYIEKWSKIKAESKGGKRELAKLFLNALYGKFASNPNVTGKFPKLVNGVIKLVRGSEETRAPVYTAVGVFVTSWARDLTIRAAQSNYATFAYADTDSLHLFVDSVPETIECHPTKLGAWKLEYYFSEAYYIRAKAYMERETSCTVDLDKLGQPHEFTDGDITTHIAGVPDVTKDKMTFSDIVDGNVLTGKLSPRFVPGGVVLEDIPFTLKV